MAYKIRELETGDIFKMSKILDKMKLEIEVAEGETEEQVGIRLMKLALEKLHLAEKEVNEFIGDLVGITGEEFAKLPIKDSISIVKQFQEIEGLGDFFKLAGK